MELKQEEIAKALPNKAIIQTSKAILLRLFNTAGGIFDKIQNFKLIPGDPLRNLPSVVSWQQKYTHTINTLAELEYRLAIIGGIKAGKSTLLSAIVGTTTN